MTPIEPPTADELRQAWNRPGMAPLRFIGWSLDRALSVPTVRWSLEKSAIAARRTHHQPAQPRLI